MTIPSFTAFQTVNDGLTTFQYQHVNWMDVCPNGALYVAYIASAGGNSFLARAPSIGGTFEVLYDEPSADAEAPNTLWAVGINPLLPECIAFVKGPWHGGASRKIYVGAYGAYAAGAAIPDTMVLMNNGLSFGLNNWLLTYFNLYARIAANGSSILASGSSPTYNVDPQHLRASTTGITFHNRNGANGFLKGTNNLASLTLQTTDSIGFVGTHDTRLIDCDPTGQYIMASSTAAGGKARSTDYGATWTPLSSLPPGNWCFAYAGPGDNPLLPRFFAVGATIYYTPDFGTTWYNVTGSLTSTVTFPAIDLMKVLEY